MTTTPATRPLRVLIVEDHFAVADSLRMFLENSGFEIVGMAGTLDAATALVERGGFQKLTLGGGVLASVAFRSAKVALLSRSERRQIDN